jgi:DNA-binding transcriptional MocR family regulator
MKQAEDLQAGSLVQAALVRLLDQGVEHMTNRLRAAYCDRRDNMLEALRTEFGNRATWNVPQGGFFVWVTLPSNMDATDLLREAASLGVTFVPGAAFTYDDSCRNALRLSFSAAPVDSMSEGIRRLARAYDLIAA